MASRAMGRPRAGRSGRGGVWREAHEDRRPVRMIGPLPLDHEAGLRPGPDRARVVLGGIDRDVRPAERLLKVGHHHPRGPRSQAPITERGQQHHVKARLPGPLEVVLDVADRLGFELDDVRLDPRASASISPQPLRATAGGRPTIGRPPGPRTTLRADPAKSRVRQRVLTFGPEPRLAGVLPSRRLSKVRPGIRTAGDKLWRHSYQRGD